MYSSSSSSSLSLDSCRLVGLSLFLEIRDVFFLFVCFDLDVNSLFSAVYFLESLSLSVFLFSRLTSSFGSVGPSSDVGSETDLFPLEREDDSFFAPSDREPV